MVTPSVDEMEEAAMRGWGPEEDWSGEPSIAEAYAKCAKEAAGRINSETAEVCCFYEEANDPYGVIRESQAMPPRGDVLQFYAREPETAASVPFGPFGEFAAQRISPRYVRPWVWFGDLPEAVRDALREKHQEN